MRLLRTLAPCFLLACVFLGCSDSTGPVAGNLGDGYTDFEGEIDPQGNTFVLASIEVPSSDGVPVRVELIGRLDVRVPIRPGEVPIAVAVRNVDRRSLYPPAEIILSHFRPVSVFPVAGNPDWTRCPPETDSTAVGLLHECNYGYVYSDLLGDDGVLSPGETSEEKLWVFWDPDRVPFSFAAHARFSLEPDRARIAGVFFHDANRNGEREASEPPFGGGAVWVSGPGVKEHYVAVGEDGRYSIFVREPGLYNLRAVAPPTFAPVDFTTPNPLEVLLLRGSDGQPQSFLHADFGLANTLTDFPPVLFNEGTQGLHLDPYSLLGIELDRYLLRLRVGYSGCSADHPLQLYMVGGFMESYPVQARILLDHNSRDELCRAYFERDLVFDMRPILRAYQEQYGEADVVILRFEDWHGETHKFELHP